MESRSARSVGPVRAAFEWSAHPMLIADDRRQWVTGNVAACELLGIAREEVPWRSMDEFTPQADRAGLAQRWDAFLADGVMEGCCRLQVPDRGPVPVEFSATANVLPARHLTVFIPPDDVPDESLFTSEAFKFAAARTPEAVEGGGRLRLTQRESEVITLVAAGLHTTDMAERLFLSNETVKSHVQNAMGKLGSHTRAHAVAIALVTGQITWEQ